MRRQDVFARAVALALLLAACGGPSDRTAAPEDMAASTGPLALHPSFSDEDPHAWEGRSPDRYPVHGLDVSRWQGPVDWRAAREGGVSFAFIKATEGGDLIDPLFDSHWQGAGRAGVRRGAYHLFYFCRPAEEQARWFIRHVPKSELDLPPVLDIEWTPFSPTCTIRPPWDELRPEVETFLALLERHYGRRPIVYTTPDFWRETGISRLPGTAFWLRSVAGHPSEVYPGTAWTFWQYTGTGIVPGVTGPVDINVFAGSPEQWRDWPG